MLSPKRLPDATSQPERDSSVTDRYRRARMPLSENPLAKSRPLLIGPQLSVLTVRHLFRASLIDASACSCVPRRGDRLLSSSVDVRYAAYAPATAYSHRAEGPPNMRFRVVMAVLACVTLLGSAATLAPPAVAAMPCGHQFGSPQQLTDAGGAVVQEWVISDLRESSVALPGYTARGQVWEASATVRAVTGTVTPIIPNLYTVTADGQRYPVLWQIASPQGLPATTLGQGQASSGAIYFDAVGPQPMAVVYDNGAPTQLFWCCTGSMMMMPMEKCPMCADMQRACPHCPGGM